LKLKKTTWNIERDKLRNLIESELTPEVELEGKESRELRRDQEKQRLQQREAAEEQQRLKDLEKKNKNVKN